MRVRVKKLPLDKAAYGKQVDGSLSLQPGAFGGADYRGSDKKNFGGVNESISAVPREEANLEAEGGETAFGPISGQSIPDHVKIKGKRHHEGGVPLNLPDDTFVFSDTAALRINEPSILAMFNKAPKKGGYTPAELAKPYNINKYKAILLDPDSGKLERNTAVIMIKNYIMKLGALALVQESMKGFPQGIPEMARPYMEANGITEEDLMPELKEQADALAQSMESQGQPMMGAEEEMMGQEQMIDQGQGQLAYPEQMPSGAPVASPEMMQQMAGSGAMPPPDMMQAPAMMAYGGAYEDDYNLPFYSPEMAYGGYLPQAQDGIEKVKGKTGEVTATRVEALPGKGTTSTTISGKPAEIIVEPGAERTYVGKKAIPGGGKPSSGWAGSLCNRLMQGATIDQLVSEGHGTKAGLTNLLKDCIPKAEEKFADVEKAVYVDPAVAEQEIETLFCRCVDPVTGQVNEFPIEKEEDCNCQDGSQGEVTQGMATVGSLMEAPHWSRNARLNILRNMMMKTTPAASNVVLPGRAQVQGVYEEYQTKVDQALAANNAMQTAIMQGLSGATGTKQAQMKDIMGKSIRASMDAVAGVQSRNVDRQGAVNVQNPTIDNTYMMANSQLLNQGLENQRIRRDTETSNENRKLYNTFQAIMDANKEMADRYNLRQTTPQFGSEFEMGYVYPTGVEKPLTGATGSTYDDRVQYWLSRTGDIEKAAEIAYKESRVNKAQHGGYIYSDMVFPFDM